MTIKENFTRNGKQSIKPTYTIQKVQMVKILFHSETTAEADDVLH